MADEPIVDVTIEGALPEKYARIAAARVDRQIIQGEFVYVPKATKDRSGAVSLTDVVLIFMELPDVSDHSYDGCTLMVLNADDKTFIMYTVSDGVATEFSAIGAYYSGTTVHISETEPANIKENDLWIKPE